MRSNPELTQLLERAAILIEAYAELCDENGKSHRAEEALTWVDDADDWQNKHKDD